MRQNDVPAFNAALLARYERGGLTYAQLASELGVGKQRVYQRLDSARRARTDRAERSLTRLLTTFVVLKAGAA